MQNRYAGDVGDYVKLALLRTLATDYNLGVAWYLHPDEAHNADGRHISYLDQPSRWRDLDPELFDALANTVRSERSVLALERTGILGASTFAREQISTSAIRASLRSSERTEWFGRTLDQLGACDLVFADPDNGLIDDSPARRRQAKFGKQMPLAEAHALADGRTVVIYHHNTRYPGGHDLEVADWQQKLGPSTLAVRANSFSCRTFFIVNPTPTISARAEEFCHRWADHRVWLCHSAA